MIGDGKEEIRRTNQSGSMNICSVPLLDLELGRAEGFIHQRRRRESRFLLHRHSREDSGRREGRSRKTG